MTFSKTFVFLVIFFFLLQCLPPARFSKQTYVYPLFLDPSSNPQLALPPSLFIYCKKYCGAYEQKYVLTPEYLREKTCCENTTFGDRIELVLIFSTSAIKVCKLFLLPPPKSDQERWENPIKELENFFGI